MKPTKPAAPTQEQKQQATKAKAKQLVDKAEQQAKTIADKLVRLASAAELFHTKEGIGYGDVKVNGHRETWRVRSRAFRRWLTHAFFESYKGVPNAEAMNAALGVIEGTAYYKGPEREVCVRVAEQDGCLYLDLCDADWRAVEISTDGWQVITDPPVRFERNRGMLPLPEPQMGGSLDDLRGLLNIRDEQFPLVKAVLQAMVRPRGPYPVLNIEGEQGSAKSTTARVMKQLLDPASAPLRTLPREARDLFISASHAHVLAFDNVSTISEWISDDLCRLATGGGFSTRVLYEDAEEIIFEAMRPVILNGIEGTITRPDLADRAVRLTQEAIPDEQRKSEKVFWREFEEAHPQLLGALLDSVVIGLRNLPHVVLDRLPRMADFALFAVACENVDPAESEFLAVYAANRAEANVETLDQDPLTAILLGLIEHTGEFDDTANALLQRINGIAEVENPQMKRSKHWPRDPSALGSRLRRKAKSLRDIGIDIEFYREPGGTRARKIKIANRADNAGKTPSYASRSVPLAGQMGQAGPPGRQNGQLVDEPMPPRPRSRFVYRDRPPRPTDGED
jgi:hypothetical protein